MEKKCVISSVLTVIIMAVFSMSFVACSSSDSDSDSPANKAIGTWYMVVDQAEYNLVFNNNGTGTLKVSIDGKSYSTDFDYKMDDNTKGYLLFKNESTKNYYVVDGDKMYIYANGYGQGDFLTFTRISYETGGSSSSSSSSTSLVGTWDIQNVVYYKNDSDETKTESGDGGYYVFTENTMTVYSAGDLMDGKSVNYRVDNNWIVVEGVSMFQILEHTSTTLKLRSEVFLGYAIMTLKKR